MMNNCKHENIEVLKIYTVSETGYHSLINGVVVSDYEEKTMSGQLEYIQCSDCGAKLVKDELNLELRMEI